MLHALARNILVVVHRWAWRPFATAGFLGLVMLIATAGPWACITHCAYPAGSQHAPHHSPRHVLPGAGDTGATSVAGGIGVLGHRDHHPAVHHTVGDMKDHVGAVPAVHVAAEMGMRAQPAGIPETGDSGTLHTVHCPPGPTMTALTVAIMLPAAPVLRMVVLLLPRSTPLPSYRSVDSHPPGPPPRASNTLAT